MMKKAIFSIFFCFMAMTGYAFGAGMDEVDVQGFESQDIGDWIKFPSASELGADIYSPGYMSDYCVKIDGAGLKPPEEDGYISSLPQINSGYISIEKPVDWKQGSVYTLRCIVRADRDSTSDNNNNSKAYLECTDPDGDMVLSKSPLFIPTSEWTEYILNGYIRNSPMATIKLGYAAGQGTVYYDNVSFYNSSCYLQSNTLPLDTRPLVFYVHDADDGPLTVTINRLQGATASTTPVVSVSDPFGSLKLTKTCESGNQLFNLTIPSDNILGDYRIEIPQDISSVWQVSAKDLIFESRDISVS